MTGSPPHLDWDGATGELVFQTEELSGVLRADGLRHGLVSLVHRPTGTAIPSHFLLAIYRLLARDAWMGEARIMAHEAVPTEDGVVLTWAPTPAHHAQLGVRFAIRPPDELDVTVSVVGHAYYPAYEVYLSNYFAPAFASGAYLEPVWGEPDGRATVVRPEASPIFREMYVSFPRDEPAANMLTDGRWQRGRHFTRHLPARYYAIPAGFYADRDGPVDCLLMGLRRDVAAVTVAYATDDPEDGVGQHNSLYFSLFGRDLHPGEAWETRVRLVVAALDRDAEAHYARYDAFLADAGESPASIDLHDLGGLRGLGEIHRDWEAGE